MVKKHEKFYKSCQFYVIFSMLNCNHKNKRRITMKYNCANEFDLNEIYRKLTSASQPRTVKACEFFVKQKISLLEFQQNMNKLFSVVTR